MEHSLPAGLLLALQKHIELRSVLLVQVAGVTSMLRVVCNLQALHPC
jgi:hypothetical protein